MNQKIHDHVRNKLRESLDNHTDDPVYFHIGPAESMELSDEVGYDFIAYCGVTVLGSIHGGGWEQEEANKVCNVCSKGLVVSAMRGLSGESSMLNFSSIQ